MISAPSLDPAPPLSDSTPGYVTMGFPTLFPDDAGDFHWHQARLRKVDIGKYVRFPRWTIRPAQKFSMVRIKYPYSTTSQDTELKQQHDAGRLTIADIGEMSSESD